MATATATRKPEEISITFHADYFDPAVAAINVKRYGVFPFDCDPMLEEVGRIFGYGRDTAAEVAWDRARDQFWADAEHFATRFGFTGVHAEGRSGGWLVPEIDGDGVSEEDMRASAKLRRAYARLDAEISTMLREVPERIREQARELREEATRFDGC